jgi:hypothetical protein
MVAGSYLDCQAHSATKKYGKPLAKAGGFSIFLTYPELLGRLKV